MRLQTKIYLNTAKNASFASSVNLNMQLYVSKNRLYTVPALSKSLNTVQEFELFSKFPTIFNDLFLKLKS